MHDYLIGLAINATVGLTVAAILAWHYRRTVALPLRLRALQYRLFAIRDRAIRMVAEGIMREEDPQFQFWYELFNRTATSAAVGRIQNGFSFVLHLLRSAGSPKPDQIKAIQTLPEPMQQLVGQYAITVVSVLWEGSFLIRILARLAERFTVFKAWIKRRRPEEAERYVEWNHFADCQNDHCVSV